MLKLKLRATCKGKLKTNVQVKVKVELCKMAKVGQNGVKLTAFQERVYAVVTSIPRGKVATYGIVASEVGTSARAVGGAMGKNPFAPRVP